MAVKILQGEDRPYIQVYRPQAKKGDRRRHNPRRPSGQSGCLNGGWAGFGAARQAGRPPPVSSATRLIWATAERDPVVLVRRSRVTSSSSRTGVSASSI